MDEGVIDSREAAGSTPGSARRNSLAGMFPFLQKQQSMDTDSSDRQQRRGMGGKVKPGKQHSRSSSGDVSDSLTPGPGDVSSSAAWHEAAGHGSSTTPQGWPSSSPAPSTSTTTPSRGLFSKLLSGKKKHKGSHSPTHVAVPNSPPLGSLSLGGSSNGSQSPKSHSEQLPDYIMNVGGYGRRSSSSGACLPVTPPHHHRHAVDADRAVDEEGDYDSCYSTPIGSEAMLSPNQDYGGDTLDLRHMVYDAHGDKSPMPMRQDLPEVFTPGFNELLQQAGGRLQPQEPDTPPAGAQEEPTVALLTGAQLAQAGCMFDAPAMLLDPTAAQQQQGSTAASRSSSRCNGGMAAGSKAASTLSSAVTSPEPAQAQQLAGTAACSPTAAAASADSSELQPVCADDIELQVGAANTVDESEAAAAPAAAAAAEEPLRPSSPTSDRRDAAVGEQIASATAVAEPAAEATETVASGAEDAGAAAGTCPAACEDSMPVSAAVGTVDCASPAGIEQLAVPEAAEDSCIGADETAAVDEQQPEPEAVQDAAAVVAAAEPAEEEAVSPARSSSSSSTGKVQLLEDAEQAVPAAAEVEADVREPEVPALSAAEAAAEPAADAAPVPVTAAAEPSPPPAAEPATPPADAQPADVEPVMAAAAADASPTAVQAVSDVATGAAAPAAAAVGDEVDEFALLEQQVIAEVAEEAAVDEFALLEQQVAAEEAEADEFAELERLAAAEAAAESSAGAVAAEGSSGSLGSVPQMQITEEPSLPLSEPSEGAEGGAPALSAEQSGSPDGNSRPSAAGSDDSPVLGLTSSARRAARRSPMNLVRESMPLFLADPSRAMGSPLALQPGEESLDDQDMQQLSAGNAYRGSSGGGYGGARLLSHGGAQRVSLGGSGLAGGSSFMSSLEPVEEASFTSAGSPIPEGSPSFANQQGIGDSPRSDARCTSAAAGSPGDMSPLHPSRLSGAGSGPDAAAAGQVTPCSAAGGPNLAMTPGSVYSTPTLAFGASGQNLETPQSNVSSAIGSAIRASGAVAGPLELSPAMPDSMPEASPTLMLMPGQGFDNTVALQGADGSTPSLLDARAASPSAVYATRFTATPFRGALAALPMDAALAAPLVDSSPFSLRDDCGMDTVCLADEAQRVAANLAAAAAAGAYSPGQAATPMRIPTQAGSPGSAAAEGRVGSPTEELRDLQLVMLTRQLAELQKKNKDLEADNVRLKEQVEIYEFEKTELNSQEEMEKQARQYAEEQLQAMQVEMQQLMQAKAAQAAEILAMRQEFKGIQQQAQERHNTMRAANEQLAVEKAQLQDERDKALDQLNMLDMQITALKSNNNELMIAVEAEQARYAQLEAALAARDRDLSEAGRVQAEFQAKVEKMMGQVIAADTTKEHYRQKAADEAAKVQQMVTQQQQVMAERQQLLAEREKRAQDYQHLKQKYAHKSAALKECEAKLQAKDAENQELMTMCDQLLQQQEARRQ